MTKRLVALIGAAVIVLAACNTGTPTTAPGSGQPQGSGPAATEPAGGLAEEQILKIYLSDTDPATLNPAAAQDSVSIAVLDSIHRPLLYYDADLALVPSLAEALPEISNEGKTLTFKIRAGASYADGDPIVAGDIVRAFQRLLDPRAANPYAYIACDLAGAEALLGAELGCGTGATPTDDAAIDALLEETGVSAPDDTTVVVDLKQPATYFGSIMAMWIAMPQKEEWTAFAEAADLGCVRPVHDRHLGPQRPDHARSEPQLVRRREADPDRDPDAHRWRSCRRRLRRSSRATSTLVTVSEPGHPARRAGSGAAAPDPGPAQLAITYYDYTNCQAGEDKCPEQTGTSDGKSATQNKNFRIALTQAVNKQQFIDLTFGGIGEIANSVVMPGIPGYDADYNPYPYDTAAAQAAMATAHHGARRRRRTRDEDGAVTAADLGPMRFGYNCNAGHLPRVAFLAEAWRTTLGFAETSVRHLVHRTSPTFLQERPAGRVRHQPRRLGCRLPAREEPARPVRLRWRQQQRPVLQPGVRCRFNDAATIADPAEQEAKYIEAQQHRRRRRRRHLPPLRPDPLPRPAVRQWPDVRPRRITRTSATCSTRPSQCSEH